MSVSIVTSGGNVSLSTSAGSAIIETSTGTNIATWDRLVALAGRGYLYGNPTGVEIIYRVGDDYDIEQSILSPAREANKLKAINSLADFYTLNNTNSFGNTIRFTNTLGAEIWDGTDGSITDYMIDNYSGLGWRLVADNNISWDDAIDYAIGATISGFTGWFVPNVRQMFAVKDAGNPLTIQPPFQSLTNGVRMYTSTAGRGGVNEAGQKNYVTWRTEVRDSSSGGTPLAGSNGYYFYCRKHF